MRLSQAFTKDSWPPGTLHRISQEFSGSTGIQRKRGQAKQKRPKARVPQAGEQDDGSLPQTPLNYRQPLANLARFNFLMLLCVCLVDCGGFDNGRLGTGHGHGRLG